MDELTYSSEKLGDLFVNLRTRSDEETQMEISRQAQQGSTLAETFMILIHHYGLGMEETNDDLTEEIALRCWPWLLQFATDSNTSRPEYPYALYILASCYTIGIPYGKDLQQAEVILQQISSFDYPPAIYSLATLPSQTHDIKLQLLHQAAEKGFALAYTSLANIYSDELEQYAVALDFYQKAADQLYGSAFSDLALLYYIGDHVPEDRDKAMELLVLAAKAGDAFAMIKLGDLDDTELHAKRHYYHLAIKKSRPYGKVMAITALLNQNEEEKSFLQSKASSNISFLSMTEISSFITVLRSILSAWRKQRDNGIVPKKLAILAIFQLVRCLLLTIKSGEKEALFQEQETSSSSSSGGNQ